MATEAFGRQEFSNGLKRKYVLALNYAATYTIKLQPLTLLNNNKSTR